MGDLFGTIAAAAVVFAGTNIDDVIVLTVLFLSTRAVGKPKPAQIWTGQYMGIALLVLISAVAAAGLMVVADDWVGLVGIVPVGLGVWGLAKAIRAHGQESVESLPGATGLIPVIGVTMANGADNISVYTPMFRTIGPSDSY